MTAQTSVPQRFDDASNLPSPERSNAHALERDESPAEQLDRQWNELLQELRVTQTGLQLLSGFLLTLPFQQRFEQLDGGLKAVFVVAVSSATIATVLVVGPVALHRGLFRTHNKDALVQISHTMAKAGLVLLSITMAAVTWVTLGVVLGPPWGVVGATAITAVFVVFWFALPRLVRRRWTSDAPYISSTLHT